MTAPVPVNSRIYETDIPAGMGRWVQIKDDVVNQVLNEDRDMVAGAQYASNEGQASQERGGLEAGSDPGWITQIGDELVTVWTPMTKLTQKKILTFPILIPPTVIDEKYTRTDSFNVTQRSRRSALESARILMKSEWQILQISNMHKKKSADTIDIKRFWDLEGLKVKAEDIHEYSRAGAALAVDPTKPQIVGMTTDTQLKAWQVTGLTWMIAKEKGVVELQQQADPGEYARTLPCLGGIVACQTRMAKTLQLCALIQEQTNRQTQGDYGTIVGLAPPSITEN